MVSTWRAHGTIEYANLLHHIALYVWLSLVYIRPASAFANLRVPSNTFAASNPIVTCCWRPSRSSPSDVNAAENKLNCYRLGCRGQMRNAASIITTTRLFSSTSSSTESSTSGGGAPLPPAISLENLSCSHNGGETWQLKDTSYVLARGSKVALVGRNGTGKSTLLRILAENACLDTSSFQTSSNDQGVRYTGRVTTPRDVRVAYVEQEPHLSSDLTVADALLGMRERGGDADSNNRSVYATVRRYIRAVETATEEPERFADASAAMEAQAGWDVLTKAEEVATKLRVRHLQEQTLDKLSGGERKRVALAAALVQEPDVLLLDEPTNFLSLAGVQWLTDLLNQDKKLTLLMVTHDRAFLGDVCDRILELDHGSVYEYLGSYSDYLQGKEERLAIQDAAIQASKAKYRVELEWMRRQPQARQSKSKARIDAFYKLEKATKPRPRDAKLSIDSHGENRRIGGKVIGMRGVSLKLGDRVMLNDFSYDFCKGDRICFSGANGVGKTTLVNTIIGSQAPDSGEIDIGDTVVIGVYDQKGIDITDPTQTVLEFVLEAVNAREFASSDGTVEARQLLKQFEFPRERWNERVSVLSGGEKRRLQMLSVFSKKPNVLILDEPSVDCDLDTLNALESYLLEEFDGVLLVVSHDRLFADTVTDHLFVFEGDGEIKDFQGTLSEYATTLIQLESDSIPGQKAIPSEIDGDLGDRKAAYKEDRDKRNEEQNRIRRAKKDVTNLERALEKLKLKAQKTQKEIDDSSEEGWTVLAGLTETLEGIKEEIDVKEIEWMKVAEILEESGISV